MKKLIVIIALIVVVMPATAQVFIKENRDRAAGVFHIYETFDTQITPAPRGYKPFYISHYGRHGSRFQTEPFFFQKAITRLEACDSMCLLSEQGKALLSDIKYLKSINDGHYETLTAKGGFEHQGIAKRMCENYEQVFTNPKRNQVQCISSPSVRSVQSMGNFCMGVYAYNPKLKITQISGDVLYKEYMPDLKDYIKSFKDLASVRDSVFRKSFSPEYFCNIVFKDPKQAMEKVDVPMMAVDVFFAGIIVQNLDGENPDIFRVFSDQELYALMIYLDRSWGSRLWKNNFNTEDSASAHCKDILARIVAAADNALAENSNCAADLRFFHDNGVVPLSGLIGLEPFDKTMDLRSSEDTMQSFRYICMASNIQMIFFKNKSDDILVKFLYNEHETLIAGLQSFSGPFYKWPELREYLVSRCK